MYYYPTELGVSSKLPGIVIAVEFGVELECTLDVVEASVFIGDVSVSHVVNDVVFAVTSLVITICVVVILVVSVVASYENVYSHKANVINNELAAACSYYY